MYLFENEYDREDFFPTSECIQCKKVILEYYSKNVFFFANLE